MKRCKKLWDFPTDIDLESLHSLNLSGCSKLESFPHISRNISNLVLDETKIEDVPERIEDISGLNYILMTGFSNLKHFSSNISKLKHLEMMLFAVATTTDNSGIVHNRANDVFLSFHREDVHKAFDNTKRIYGISFNVSEMEQRLARDERLKGMKRLRFVRMYKDSLYGKEVRVHLVIGLHSLWYRLNILPRQKGNAYFDGRPTLHVSVSVVNVACKLWRHIRPWSVSVSVSVVCPLKKQEWRCSVLRQRQGSGALAAVCIGSQSGYILTYVGTSSSFLVNSNNIL
ncbi:hypothetical protein YC2023_103323 [Brassica napus]